MSDISINNKRIAKNAIFLNARMILVLGLSLYTSRVVLATLGVEEFGVFNVVAGVATMFTFFTSSLSNASQRYLSIELGKGDITQANKVFNLNILLFAFFALALFVVLETVGLWFVNNKLVLPIGRLHAVNIVYQLVTVQCLITIVQVPFVSAIIAEERMGFYAYMGIFDVAAKLAIVFFLNCFGFDKLILYAILLLAIQCLTALIYVCYTRCCFVECKFRYYWNRELAVEMMKFISATAYGCLAWAAAYQGTTVVLNMFFGPVVNAARGIAMQVNSAINNFSSAMITAVKPQIIKSFSSNQLEYMEKLVIISSKFSLVLMVLLSFPIIYNIDFILDVWLKEVPEFTSIFTVLIIVDSAIASLLQPIGIAINATGLVRNMQVYGRSFTLLSLPVSYLLYKFKLVSTPDAVFYVLIVAQIAYFLYSLNDMCKKLNFSFLHYLRSVVMSVVFVSFLSFVILYVLRLNLDNQWEQFFLRVIVSLLVVSILSFIFVVTKNEKKMLYAFFMSKFFK